MGEITKASSQPLSEPGVLWQKVVRQTQHALACGALHSIPTEANFIEQSGIRFLVRVLASLTRKEAAKRQQAEDPDFNPFLPYDPDLFVADLSTTHVCLLNKYNVVDHHLLIITREFEEQETLLTLSDFEALWICLSAIEGLGFYNSGKMAGASQRHKHLQLVPLPLTPTGEEIPIEAIFPTVVWNGTMGKSPALPFQHALMRLDGNVPHQQAAKATLEAYLKLLTTFDLYSAADQLKGVYNLLITREWMLLVPRTQEQFESIPVNSLGFAGTLFVRSQQQFEQLKTMEPLTLLKQVAVAIESE